MRTSQGAAVRYVWTLCRAVVAAGAVCAAGCGDRSGTVEFPVFRVGEKNCPFLAIAPDGTSILAVVSAEDKWVVLRDGERVGEEYEAVGAGDPSLETERLTLSPGPDLPFSERGEGAWRRDEYQPPPGWPVPAPGGRPVVFRAVTGARPVIIRDGRPVSGEYGKVWAPVLSPDGSSLAYCAVDGKKAVVVKDGEVVGERYEEVRAPVFSPDGASLAFAAALDDRWVIVRDGTEVGGRWDYVRQPVFSPDGASVAFAAALDGKWRVMRDGEQVGGPYDVVGQPVFSPDGESIAFRAGRRRGMRVRLRWGSHDRERGWHEFIVETGKRKGTSALVCAEVRDPIYAPDGTWVVFAAKAPVRSGAMQPAGWPFGWCVVQGTGARIGGPYEDVGEIVMSRDGSLAYAAKRGGADGERRWVTVKNGKSVGERWTAVRDLVFGPDGRSLAFVAEQPSESLTDLLEEEKDEAERVYPFRVVKDGEPVGRSYQQVSRLVTSRDGRRLVFAARREKDVYYVSSPW